MHFLFPKLVFFVLLPVFAVSTALGVEFTLLEAAGVRTVVPNAVSADGSTVVGRAVFPLAGDTTGQRAFRWREGEGFTVFSPVLGGASAEANAVSADGSVIVGRSATALGYGVGARWTDGGGIPVFDGASTNDTPTAEALGVSGDGRIVAGFHRNNDNNVRAFHWVANPDGPGGIFTGYREILSGTSRGSGRHWNRFNGVSGDGRYLVGWSDGVGHSGAAPVQAVRVHRESGAVDALGFLPGGANQSDAFAVSADGSVIAGLASSTVGESTGGQFFRWTPETGMQGLGILLSGVAHAAISADGGTIVGTSQTRAFMWTAETGVVFLDTLVPELAAWESTHGRGVSGDGRVIAGYGFPPGVPTSSGNEVGWVIRLPEPVPPPEPPPTPALNIAADPGSVAISFTGEATLAEWDYLIERSTDLLQWNLHALVSPMGSGMAPLVSTGPAGIGVDTAFEGDEFTLTLFEFPPPAIFYRLVPVLRQP